MRYKKMSTIGTLLAVLMLAIAVAVLPAGALPTGEDSKTTAGSATTYGPTADSAPARGGYITDVTFVNVNSSTSKWQGFYGNVSGNIVLGTAAGDKMYQWTVSTPAGEVFATQTETMTLANWEALSAKTGANIDTAFEFTAGDSDSGANTFDQDPSAIVVAGRSIDGDASTAAKTYNSANSSTWTTIALGFDTTEASFVFAGIISSNGDAYDGTSKDFQMIVPENADTGDDTYYFYVELT